MQKRAIKTRQKILTTATTLFARHGMRGTTVDRIAETAGVNKQRIYAYFGSKEKLFITAVTNVFKAAEPFSESMISEAEKHPERLTEILLHGFRKFHEANPLFWRLLAWANLEDARLLEPLKNARKQQDDAIRKIFLAAGKNSGPEGISFENYLFTMLAVPWFLRSNALTLRYTLGYDPAEDHAANDLFADLNHIFQGNSGTATSPSR